MVVTTDAVVEGVHFSRAFFSPADIGHKALAVNLSDLAAMAATPRWALLSLVLPGSWLVADVEELVDGLSALAGRHGVSVVGGNITRTNGPLVVDVTAGGDVGSRRWLTRSGACPGDDIYLSGTIGAAATGLEILRARYTGTWNGEPETGTLRADPGSRPAPSLVEGLPACPEPGRRAADSICVARQRRPEPRVRLGVAMGRARAARAAMDLSDGLADALRQVAAASGCGVRIDGAALPIEPAAAEWWNQRGIDPVSAALACGEDYELLFAVPKRGGGRLRTVTRHVADPPLTKIGAFTKDAGAIVVERDGREEPLPAGYEHYR